MGRESNFFTNEQLQERGFVMRDPPMAILAYDPSGSGKDRDGIVILSREELRRGELDDPDLAVEIVYRALYASYMPRDLEFPDKMAKILSLHRAMMKWAAKGKMHSHIMLVETNGIGHSAKSFLQTKVHRYVRGYTTVAAVHDRHVMAETGWVMPRNTALDNLRSKMELQRFKAEKGAPGMTELKNEFASFVWKNNVRPEAIDGQHDDLVMPSAAACYFGDRLPLVTRPDRQPPSTTGLFAKLARA